MKHKSITLEGKDYMLIPLDEYLHLTQHIPKQALAKGSAKNYQSISASDIGKKILAARNQFGLSEEAFAKLAKTTQAQISRLQSGQSPRVKTIKKIELAIQGLYDKKA